MPALDPAIRKDLERAVVAARVTAEEGARAALDVLAFDADSAPAGTPDDRRELRNALRARARILGEGSTVHGKPLLVEEIAYEAWHRLLFARFLAENHLLLHPDYGVSVTLAECEELAAGEPGDADRWDVAARFASAMLPGLFREDDPAVRVRLAREHRLALEGLVAGLDEAVFRSDDGLGWVYQFWQSRKKDEVNKSGRKIGGADLAPVTQLFTEDYMVRFLLENSLGAWWAARHPDSPLLREWEYLRFAEDGAPAAGSFPGWPDRPAEVTVMDPCCGSGHFLVRAFDMLRRMRMEEEGLSSGEAADAVLRDNLFGLELDPRCTQIAAFAVALEAWKLGGHPEVNPPQIACSGVPVGGQLEEWLRIAGFDERLRGALTELYALFGQAPTFGSLIDPRQALASIPPLLRPDWEQVEAAIYDAPAPGTDASVFALAAIEAVRGALLLSRSYALVATNVPYLQRGNQSVELKAYLEDRFYDARADLATAMLDRCSSLCQPGGSSATVLPQNWLFLGSYKSFRSRLLKGSTWQVLARLGSGAFTSISGQVVNVVLLIHTTKVPSIDNHFIGIDASGSESPFAKAQCLAEYPLVSVSQQDQQRSPDARITFDPGRFGGTLLSDFATSYKGLCTGDVPRFLLMFWEIPYLPPGWVFQQTTAEQTTLYGGMHSVFRWGDGTYADYVADQAGKLGGSWKTGSAIWGNQGVLVSQTGKLKSTTYLGDAFDNNNAVIVPKDQEHLAAIWSFCSDPNFNAAVREIDQKLSVTSATLAKVPFDLEHWQRVAAEQYPNGLPEPHSDDPTQWLFAGHPKGSDDPLQVAVARLLGYRWPEQPEHDGLERHADRDGIVCLKPVRGEDPASARLLALLADAWGDEWSPAVLERLLAGAGFAGKSLDDWLADGKGFFAQHCRLFHNRPFIWHVWDGARDGFSALVNYHRLDRQTLDKLINSYLGDWIATQRALAAAGEAGADNRLAKAIELKQKLELIQQGEPPCDVYVRWKPLARQPIGWDPDLDDGVRLNVRPFVSAGVLRAKFSVNWNKDRGDNPAGSDAFAFAREAQLATVPPLPAEHRMAPDLGRERLNDLHLTVADRRQARERERQS